MCYNIKTIVGNKINKQLYKVILVSGKSQTDEKDLATKHAAPGSVSPGAVECTYPPTR